MNQNKQMNKTTAKKKIESNESVSVHVLVRLVFFFPDSQGTMVVL